MGRSHDDQHAASRLQRCGGLQRRERLHDRRVHEWDGLEPPLGGLEGATCEVKVAAGGGVCDGVTIDRKTANALKKGFWTASSKLTKAATLSGKKRTKQLKLARAALTTARKKAAAAGRRKKNPLPAACATEVGCSAWCRARDRRQPSGRASITVTA
jgi:hypothetical protein